MKKVFCVMFFVFSFFVFVSCGSSDDPVEGNNVVSDSENGDTAEEPDDNAASSETETETDDRDTSSETDAETGDNDTADLNDSESVDDGDNGEVVNPDTGECAVVSIGTMRINGSVDSYAYYYGTYQPGTGNNATADEIDFEIYSETTTGVYDLSEGHNASYSSCAQCIMVFEDIVYDNEGYFEGAGKYYFQQSGTMTVNSFSYDSGSLNVTLENVKLIEVTREYDSENHNFISNPVENGGCMIIQNTTLNI